MKNDTLLHKWYNKTISKEELEEFKKRPEYASLVQVENETSALEGPEFDSEQMLDEILATKGTVSEKHDAPGTPKEIVEDTKVRSITHWIKYAVAASVLLLAGYFVISSEDNNVVTYEIAEAQQVEGTLPDQSTFVLEGNSKLQYDQSAWQNNRKVSLEGEAFFSVKKGSSFTVNTPTGQVVVLGTQFAVISGQTFFRVECKEGRVSARPRSNEQTEEILTAGESLKQINGATITRKTGLTKMKNVTLQLVVEELTHHFGVEILTQDLDLLESLSCNFKHSDLSLALKTTLSPLNIEYKILDNNKVELYK